MFETLDVDLAWKEGDENIFIPIMVVTVCFTLYWFVMKSERIKTYYYTKYDFDQASYRHIIFTKYFGFISMGLLPVVFCIPLLPEYSLQDYGVTIIPETTLFSLIWILCLSIPIIPLVSYSARQPKNLINYPQVRSRIWTTRMMCMYALGWFIYLLGYEFLFRGILLIPLADSIGIWAAVGVNIALYSATHIPKGLDETVGAIPFGLVLCLLTLASGTIWIAFFVHVVLAWTNFFMALKYNPEMNYIKKK